VLEGEGASEDGGYERGEAAAGAEPVSGLGLGDEAEGRREE
jgi:hypothetical protein